MDKSGANFELCLRSIEEKLKTICIPIQIPVGYGKEFKGIIDLINLRKFTWLEHSKNQNTFLTEDIVEKSEEYSIAKEFRFKSIEKLVQTDEQFAEIMLERYNLDFEKMNDNFLFDSFLRKSCINYKITPVLCGSSIKNIGIEHLMDAVIKYLPNPEQVEKNDFSKDYGSDFVGICFKTILDHRKSRKKLDTKDFSLQLTEAKTNTKLNFEDIGNDMLSFVRIYNGEFKEKSTLFNINKQVKEMCHKIYMPHSNQFKYLSHASAGNIVVVSGFLKVCG